MAGYGPAPKPAHRRAGHSPKDPVPVRTVGVDAAPQPSLGELFGDVNPLTGESWSRATTVLWEQLGDFPTTAMLQSAQWSHLGRAMMLDDAVVRGAAKYAPEARLRISKYALDSDDLLRHRVQLIMADEAEAKRPASNARERYGDLRVVDAVDTG